MAKNGNLYVLGGGDEGDGDDETGEWVSPRPVDEAVVDVVTAATDLLADDLDDFEAYVDRAELQGYLEGEPASEPFIFTVEGYDVVVTPDGSVDLAPE